MQQSESFEKWKLVAENTLAVLLAEESVFGNSASYDKALFERGLRAMHFPLGNHRSALNTIIHLRSEGKPVHAATVAAAAEGVSEEWVYGIQSTYGATIDGSVFDTNVSSLLEFGEAERVRESLTAASRDLANGAERGTVIMKLMGDLANVSSGDEIENETADAGGAAFEQMLASVPVKALKTGILPMDSWMGGIGEDDVIGIAAPYKGRKCLNFSTIIQTRNGLEFIGEVIGKGATGFEEREIEIMGEHGWVRTSHVYRSPAGKTIKIKTRRGYVLEGTPHHPIRIVNGNGNLIWCELKDIRLSDWAQLRSIRNLQAGRESIFGNYEATKGQKTNLAVDHLPDRMTADLATLMGLLIADGGMGETDHFSFTKANPATLNFVFGLLKEYGISYRIDKRSNGVFQIVVPGTGLRNWIAQAGLRLDKSGTKEVPGSIMTAPDSIISAFLGGYFSGDGHVTSPGGTKKGSIGCCSKSEQLIHQLQILLLRLGIICKTYQRLSTQFGDQIYYYLDIEGEGVDLFAQCIPLINDDKQMRLQKHADSPEVKRRRELNIVPHQEERLRRIHSYGQPSGVNRLLEGRKTGDSRGGLPVARLTQVQARKIVSGARFSHDLLVLDALASDGLFYDDIVEISEGYAETYDFCVPEGHAFWSNGFISHNSSVARNVALSVAEAGGNVDVCMLESNAVMVRALFITMLAIRWMQKEGKYDERDQSNYPLRLINARDLVRVRTGYLRWHPTKVVAVQEGIRQFKALGKHLRIYDKSRKGGALSDLSSVQRVILRGKQRYGTDMAVVDHLLSLKGNGSDYEIMSRASRDLESFARHEKVNLLLLAQMNEQAIREGGQGSGSGVKGGGDFAANCDYVFSVNYKGALGGTTVEDDLLSLCMRYSRYGEGGPNVTSDLRIDPSSGLIFGVAETNLNSFGKKVS